MKTNKKGISLIVLIITILVIIIIAAAVILYLDDEKIISNAKRAVTENDIQVAKEVVAVARTEWRTKNDEIRAEGYTTFKSYAGHKLEESGFEIGYNGGQVEVSENGLLYAYRHPVIPEGYVVSSVSTEDEVSEGLVIYEGTEPVTADNVDTAQKTRNQFVWVPVPNIAEFVRKDWSESITNIKVSGSTSYKLDDVNEASKYNEMKQSVAKYGGFYIGRYEAGKNDSLLVIRKAVSVWNTKSTDEAISICQNLNNNTVVGHLVYGEEWDAALTFIAKSDPIYPGNSAGKGNFSGSKGNTGYGNKMVNNIYDMAGNYWELTQEKFKSSSCYRGGMAGILIEGSSSYYPEAAAAGFRRIVGTSSSDKNNTSFRPALYLK